MSSLLRDFSVREKIDVCRESVWKVSIACVSRWKRESWQLTGIQHYFINHLACELQNLKYRALIEGQNYMSSGWIGQILHTIADELITLRLRMRCQDCNAGICCVCVCKRERERGAGAIEIEKSRVFKVAKCLLICVQTRACVCEARARSNSGNIKTYSVILFIRTSFKLQSV